MSLRITDRDAFDSAVRKSYANRTAAATSPRTSRGAGREDVVKTTSSVLPVKHEFSQAVLEGKVDPIGVLTYGRESIPTIDVLKAKLEVAKEEEQSAINAANQYVVDNMGWLDMKDPSELQELNDAAAAATEKRVEIEREYYMNPDSFEDKVGDLGKFGRAAATVISKPFLALDVAVQTAKDAASDQNKVDMTSLPMLKYGQMQETRASITEDMSKAGAWLTNAGLSIADSAYSRLLGLGTPVGTGIVSGVSASADKMYDVAQSGEDADRTLVRGLVSGGISGASEAMSVGNLAKLLKKDGAKTVLGTMAKQGGFEATEEGVDYVANYIADKAFQDPNAKFSWSELASNMGAGGLSGAVFAGTGVAANRVNTDTHFQSGSIGARQQITSKQPTLVEQITTMQKQLADMQFQKQVDELAAVYEKNVSNANTQFSTNSHMDRTMMEENADVQGILEMAKKNGKIELTEDMEDAIARKSFSEIEELKEKLPDRVVRKWYLAHDSTILQEVDQNGNLEQRARQAFELRNINREHARDLMENQEKRVELDRSDPNKTFEELISDKMRRKGLTREEALQDILNTAGKTRASVNKMFGLGE